MLKKKNGLLSYACAIIVILMGCTSLCARSRKYRSKNQETMIQGKTVGLDEISNPNQNIGVQTQLVSESQLHMNWNPMNNW